MDNLHSSDRIPGRKGFVWSVPPRKTPTPPFLLKFFAFLEIVQIGIVLEKEICRRWSASALANQGRGGLHNAHGTPQQNQ